MEKIATVGIDLAKNVFSLHGVDANGKVVLKRTVRRAELVRLVASLPPCVIGMEACSGSHAWARQFEPFGHTVRLMAPAFVVLLSQERPKLQTGQSTHSLANRPVIVTQSDLSTSTPLQRGGSPYSLR